MQALIVADGDVPARDTIERLLDEGRPEAGTGPRLIVAADGGALKAAALGLEAHVVVGDGDSLGADDIVRLRERGAEVIVHPVAKDESDTELAVREAVTRGADRLLVIGALGGRRVEHSVANLLLLALPELEGVDIVIADGRSAARLATARRPVSIAGAKGDFVSLLPLSETVEGVRTEGMLFALADEPLTQGPARGLSNQLLAARGSVTVRAGRLLVIHTRRTADT